MRASQLAVTGVVALAATISFAPSYHVTLLAFAGIDAIVAIGLVLLMRAGQVSLGHAAFAGLGAYSAALLSRDFGVPVWLALAGGGLVAAAAAAPIGLVTLRLRGTYLPLATLALGISIYVVFMGSEFTGGSSGLGGIPALAVAGTPLGPRAIAVLIWLLVVIATLSCSKLLRSRVGRAIRTFEDHDALAVSFGVDVSRLKMKIFIASAGLAGLGGALYTFQTRFISPTPFGVGASFALLIMITLGGAAHPVGAVIGALAVSAINLALQTLFSELVDRLGPIEPVVFGALLVVLLLRWPGGIWSAIAPRLRSVPLKARDLQSGPDVTAVNVGPCSVEAGTPPLLELINIDKRFGGLQALRGLSMRVPAGKIIGLIGPNGAGKSTAFNIMSGLAQPSAGEVCFRGEALPAETQRVVERGVARTFQHVKLVGDMSVLENVALGAYWRGRAGLVAGLTGGDRAEEALMTKIASSALAEVGLLDQASDAVGTLPLGKQRMVEVARALAASPTLLLLDEPAAGLRAAEKESLVELVRKLQSRGLSIVLVEHDMNLVINCAEHLFVLDRGSLLAEGLPDAVLGNADVRGAYLGVGG